MTSASVRLSLTGSSRIRARLTSMLDQSYGFDVHLTDITADGFAGVLDEGVRRPPDAAGPFWADLTLPGSQQRLEYVVRAVPAPRESPGPRTLARWVVCESDDPTTNQANLARLRQFLGECTDPGVAISAAPAGRSR